MRTRFLSRELLAKDKPTVPFGRNLRLKELVRPAREGNHIYEFVGSDSFGAEWNQRRTYEVEAGRVAEPILFEPIYSTIRDANLPRNVTIFGMGPAGVVLEEVFEGGEVKFASIASTQKSVQMHHYAVGLEYSKDLVEYNELWSVPLVEREVGTAYNALQNHIHLSPILTASYTGANQTGANTSGATTAEDFYLTIEDAILASKTDTSSSNNRRTGPYVLLISSAQMFSVEKALRMEAQEGFAAQSSARDMIRAVIAYDGWSSTRGGKATTYAGVTAGKGYLISTAQMSTNFQSFIKQDLEEAGTQTDVTRFLTQIVWDTYFTMYANPLAAVEEITFPS